MRPTAEFLARLIADTLAKEGYVRANDLNDVVIDGEFDLIEVAEAVRAAFAASTEDDE